MQSVINILVEHQLLLLFVVITLGYAIGRINIFGIKLGAAAVLFVGLFLSALDDRLSLPAIITTLGLVLFVYSVGVSSGASFFSSFKKFGLKDLALVSAFLFFAAGLIATLTSYSGINGAISTGIFTGSLTNTPALAASINLLESGQFSESGIVPTTPTIGYSIAYPLGVIFPIVAIFFWQKRFKIDYKKDIHKAKGLVSVGADIKNKAICITNARYIGQSIRQLKDDNNWPVFFVRIKRSGKIHIISDLSTKIKRGDILSVIGTGKDIDVVAKALGSYTDDVLQFETSNYIYRRVFVSEKNIIGKTIADLHLPKRYGAIVTRIRRGDADLVADSNHVLEYGDRIRFVSPKEYEHKVAKVFGDSYRSISDIHPMSIGLGICLGLLVGMIPIHLPGGIEFELGEAGGPLVVGLILSYLRRTGPFVWTISYSANHTIRELGLSLMLAGIGVRSGQTFINGIQDGNGLQIFLIGGIISFIVPMIFIPLAYKKFKLPFAVVSGMVSAIHTQPAVTGYASQQAKNDLPTYGYVRLFPLATIMKIIVAQIMLLALV